MVESRKLLYLIGRNTKLYFKDKMLFFTSLITPIILLFLFFTFLKNVYINDFQKALQGFAIDSKILNGMAGAWLLSSVLSVSSVTVAFCANLIMAQDKVNGTINDFKITSAKPVTINISYFISTFFVVILIMLSVLLIGSIYIAIVGWYIPVADFFMMLLDIFINVLFGTLLSSIVMVFVNSQGMQSAVASLVSAMYGFISGAYMPISSFSKGLANFLGLLPGTYGTSILRNHCMQGYLQAMLNNDIPSEAIKAIKDGFDANIYVFDNSISLGGMYGIFLGSCAVLVLIFVVIVTLKSKNIKLNIFGKDKKTVVKE